MSNQEKTLWVNKAVMDIEEVWVDSLKTFMCVDKEKRQTYPYFLDLEITKLVPKPLLTKYMKIFPFLIISQVEYKGIGSFGTFFFSESTSIPRFYYGLLKDNLVIIDNSILPLYTEDKRSITYHNQKRK